MLVLAAPLVLLTACNGRKSRAASEDKNGQDHAAHAQRAAGGRGFVKDAPQGPDHLTTADSSLAWLAAANRVVLSDQGTVRAKIIDTTIRVSTYGVVSWDIRRNRKIAARTGGRVERLYVRHQYQYVHRGQKILELYAPELSTYAAEYLHHLRTPGNEELRALSQKKLRLLGITAQQIRQLERTGRIPPVFAIYSEAGGYVLSDGSNAPMPAPTGEAAMAAGGSMGADMGGGAQPEPSYFEGAGAGLPLREGIYINRGQTLFYVNDFAMAWGVLSFDERLQPLLQRGMRVVIKSELLEQPIRSTIAFVEPTFDGKGQKRMQARAYLPNTGRRLKVNSLIEGVVDIPLNGKMLLPGASVYSLGNRKVVWVKTGTTAGGKHVFRARDIQVSLMYNGIAVVAGGLRASEEVAADAGYLLDSQSMIEQ